MRLPLVTSLKNRASSTSKDGRMLNSLAETVAGNPRAIKRPGLGQTYAALTGGGQLLFNWETPDGSDIFAITNDGVTTSSSMTKTARRLSFTVQPTAVALNTAISPSIQVSVLDAFGNVVTGSSASITLALSSNQTGATLGGTVTRSASSGVATFNDITLNRSGDNFTLSASSSGLSGATSSEFDIATHLTFTVQPATTPPNTTMDPVEVTAQDSANATDTRYTGDITLSIYSASAAGVLSGTLTVPAVAGVASFTNLQIDTVGSYTLMATAADDSGSDSYTPAAQVSNSFGIGNVYTLTSVHLGGSHYGYSDLSNPPSGGSISPTQFYVNNGDIHFLYSDDGNTYLEVEGIVSQTSFTSMTLLSTTFIAASAFYNNPSGTASRWDWPGNPLNGQTGSITVIFE